MSFSREYDTYAVGGFFGRSMRSNACVHSNGSALDDKLGGSLLLEEGGAQGTRTFRSKKALSNPVCVYQYLPQRSTYDTYTEDGRGFDSLSRNLPWCFMPMSYVAVCLILNATTTTYHSRCAEFFLAMQNAMGVHPSWAELGYDSLVACREHLER